MKSTQKSRFLWLSVILIFVIFQPSQYKSDHTQHSDKPLYPVCEESPHLELSASSSIVAVNQLFEIYISYHNLGMPYTYLDFNPPGKLDFDPPITMPCKYEDGQPTDHCTVFTLRAVSSGEVTIRANADGEACYCDEEGNCFWYWTYALDNKPLKILIADKVWQLFMPLANR